MELFHSPDFSFRIEELIRRHHIPGLAIAAVQDEKIASAAYGYADLRTETQCTPDTLFDIGSSSKSLTAASVALLVADNENYPGVQYDAVMSKLLPEDFVLSDEAYTNNVTLDDLLGHRTGMPGHDDSYFGVRAAQPDDARSITRNLRNLPIAAPQRSKYLYSNMMYTVATHLIEVKTQQTFAGFLEERLFGPLGMKDSSLQPGGARNKGLGSQIATGYFWNKKSSSFKEIPCQNCPEGQGAGSIIMSVNDIIKWVKALMNKEGPISDQVSKGLLCLRSLRNPESKRLKPFTTPGYYAAGLEIYSYREHTIVWHNGVVSGFGSRFFYLPKLHFGAAVVGNSSEAASVAAMLCQELIEEVVQVPSAERTQHVSSKKLKGRGKANVTSNSKKKTRDYSTPNSTDSHIVINQIENNEAIKARFLDVEDKEPQIIHLDAYKGTYWNAGYRGMTVEIENSRLVIDATDRSMGFTLTFAHQKNQTDYIAHLRDLWEDGDDPVRAEFVLEDGKALKMGLRLENFIKDMIWFDRVE